MGISKCQSLFILIWQMAWWIIDSLFDQFSAGISSFILAGPTLENVMLTNLTLSSSYLYQEYLLENSILVKLTNKYQKVLEKWTLVISYIHLLLTWMGTESHALASPFKPVQQASHWPPIAFVPFLHHWLLLRAGSQTRRRCCSNSSRHQTLKGLDHVRPEFSTDVSVVFFMN